MLGVKIETFRGNRIIIAVLGFLILFLLVSCEKKSSLESKCNDVSCEKKSSIEYKCDANCEKWSSEWSSLESKCNESKLNKKLTIQTSSPRSSVEKGTNQKIGVRNKYGDMKHSYSVSCIITTPTGEKYNYDGGCLGGDRWSYLSYPKDFNISLPLESGKYLITWIIGKKQVEKDKFIVK